MVANGDVDGFVGQRGRDALRDAARDVHVARLRLEPQRVRRVVTCARGTRQCHKDLRRLPPTLHSQLPALPLRCTHPTLPAPTPPSLHPPHPPCTHPTLPASTPPSLHPPHPPHPPLSSPFPITHWTPPPRTQNLAVLDPTPPHLAPAPHLTLPPLAVQHSPRPHLSPVLHPAP